MKKRFRDNPGLLTEMSEQTKRNYEKDPALLDRMRIARKEAWVRRQELRRELGILATQYQQRTGDEFVIPSRREGGWKTDVLQRLIVELKERMKEV